MIQYRKDKRTDRWVLFGPASELKKSTVEVQTKAGKVKNETVERVSKSFDVGGIPHVYGYIAKQYIAKCSCSDSNCECYTSRCMCERSCNCRGGNIYDC